MKSSISISVATIGLAAFFSAHAQLNINAATTTVAGTTANLNSTTTNIGGTSTTTNLKSATTTVTGTTTNLNASTTSVSGTTTNLNSTTTNIGGTGTTTNLKAATTTITGTTSNLNAATTNFRGTTVNFSAPTTNIKSSNITFRTSADYGLLTVHNGGMQISGNSGNNILNVENKSTAAYDLVAVHGLSKPTPFYGIGGFFEGGYIGVKGIADMAGTGSRFGGYFVASNGSGPNYGIYGYAYGDAATNYGIYGEAYGGTGSTNYAGFFNGNVYAGTITQASDMMLKNDISQIDSSLDKIMKLMPVEFYYDTVAYKNMHLSSKKQCGFIAQDIERIMPDFVETEKMPGLNC